MMRGPSGDECGNLLGQEYIRPVRPECLKAPGSDLPYERDLDNYTHSALCEMIFTTKFLLKNKNVKALKLLNCKKSVILK
jgi:hypothetical protein